MEKTEFTDRHFDVIRRFVNAPEFQDIKDSFTDHTPERGADGREGDSDSKNLGKLLGTRYVFNEMKRLAKTLPKAAVTRNNNNSRQQQQRAEVDPDLES